MQSGAAGDRELRESTRAISAPNSTISATHPHSPPVGIVASSSSQQVAANGAATRETDSLSLSSISFGKDDVRMRAGEARESSSSQPLCGPTTVGCRSTGSQVTAPTRPPQAAGVCSSLHPAGSSNASQVGVELVGLPTRKGNAGYKAAEAKAAPRLGGALRDF